MQEEIPSPAAPDPIRRPLIPERPETCDDESCCARYRETMLPLALLWLTLVNVWTIRQFHADKRRAVAGARRISEAGLLQLACLGGTPGALLARRMFRHKTRKEPFSTRLMLIAAVQAGAAAALLLF